LMGVMSVLRHPGVVLDVSKISPFMATRESNWHKDIRDAQKQLRFSLLDKLLPVNAAEFARMTFFYGIKKMQRVVDITTWIAAQRKAKQDGMSEEQAVLFADRMVARSQASGIWGDRSALEQGTAGKGGKQTELLRAWTTFISYFIAKNNVFVERYRRTNFKNPASMINLLTDLALLFTVEAMVVSLLREGIPEDEEEWVEKATTGTISGITGGIPFARDAVSAAQGFPPGSTIGRVTWDSAKLFIQGKRGDFDERFYRRAINLLGIFAHIPGGQIGKSGQAIYQASEDEETTMMEFLYGPGYNRNR